MPDADFFERLGLFVRRGFFDAATCAELRDAVRAASATPATIYDGTERRKAEPGVRQTMRARVAPEVLSSVTSRIVTVKSDLERHFRLSLVTCQEPQFLTYRVGDFFSRHADAGDDPDEPAGIRVRRVSVVVFLSSESTDGRTNSHGGGSLTFYDLLPDAGLAGRGLALAAEEGLLVAFRPETVHRVSPVTAGERHSIVTWFV